MVLEWYENREKQLNIEVKGFRRTFPQAIFIPNTFFLAFQIVLGIFTESLQCKDDRGIQESFSHLNSNWFRAQLKNSTVQLGKSGAQQPVTVFTDIKLGDIIEKEYVSSTQGHFLIWT